jgi:ABC-type transport system involved in multi-copper enzyme maturation permease subunit
MGTIYQLTLRQLSGRWRLIILAVLASLPVLVALLTLQDSSAPTVGAFEDIVFGTLLAGSIAPLVALACAAAAFGNELDDRTLANLTLAPIPRWQIAVPKLLAVITVAAPFITLSAFVTGQLAYLGDWAAIASTTLGSFLGVSLYASAFVWLGLATPQAVGVGLGYIVLWEGFFSGFISGVRVLSIRQYTVDLMHALDPRRFPVEPHMSSLLIAAIATAVVVGFLLLTVRRLRRMDVP